MASVPIRELDEISLLILFAIYSAGGRSLGETHLQKIMFQTMKVMNYDPDDLEYRAHYYGPYSDVIKESEDSLELLGYITKKSGKIAISESVLEDVSRIKPPTEEIGFRMSILSESLSKLSNEELLLLIYYDDLQNNNGEYLENSEVIDGIMRNRITIAIGMYKEGKVSLERAAELAGVGITEFENRLIKRFGAVYVN